MKEPIQQRRLVLKSLAAAASSAVSAVVAPEFLGYTGIAGAASLAGYAGTASAAGPQTVQTLRIALAAPITTLDPHLDSNAPNNAAAQHIFDSLVTIDEQLGSKPGLASAWKVLDDTHWEFTLREGVKFSDGKPLGLEDIQVSIHRAATIPSVASFKTYTRSVKGITAGSKPGTIVIETHAPDPLLLNSLGRIRIISAKFKDAPSADFDAGRAAIGTGPFLYDAYVPGNDLQLKPNPTYWGVKLPWSSVTLHIVQDSGARVANLLSGGVDLVESVPPESLAQVKSDSRYHVIAGASSRVVYLGMDEHRDVTPFATDVSGKPLTKNPFKDLRVRQAIDMALNRDGIVSRVMSGNAEVSYQYLPTSFPGTSPRIRPTAYDPEKAKALLTQAGYPNGFRLTIHGPNGRYINDAKILQAVAQMLSRIGIATTVDVMPWSVYATRSNNAEFSFFLGSWGINTGETSNPLNALNATFDPAKGLGISNWGRYSNPQLDTLLAEATRTLDDTKRNTLLGQACDIVFTDKAILPLHHEKVTWAAKKNIGYHPRADQYTLAKDATQI